MAAAQMMLPANRAFNSNGLALPGATASLYTTGTTTPQNFYSDTALSISAGSTITANAAGRFDLDVYQDDTIPFRLIVKDRLGNELDDIDPFYFGAPYGSIIGTTSATFASRTLLAAVTGATGAMVNLSESGREGQFVWSSANLSTQVTNDPGQGIYVPPASAPTGSSGAWIRKYSNEINAKWFGATGDGTTDDTTAIQRGLNYVAYIGGGTLYFSEGTYKVTTYLTVGVETTVRGAGRAASIITTAAAGGGGANAFENLRNGSVFVSLSPINSSTAVHVYVEDLGITSTNGANVGTAFYNRGGTFTRLFRCKVSGFKHGAVLDQAELAEIDLCDFEFQTTSGAWLVNGADINAGASTQYTNRISITRCQFNEGAAAYGIVDDGGNSHSFQDNNYNGCLNHIRAAGVDSGLYILNGEFEGAASHCVTLNSTSLAGNAVGTCSGTISGGLYAATSGFGAVNIAAGNKIAISGGPNMSAPTGAAIRGCSNCNQLDIGVVYVPFGTLTDGQATRHREFQTNGAELVKSTGTWDGNTGANPIADWRQDIGIVRWGCAGTYLDLQGNLELSLNRYGNAVSLGSRSLIVTAADVTIANTIPLKMGSGGVTVINGSGVIQAAAMPAHTGDVTSSAGSVALTIANNAVTYAKMQDVSATARLVGRMTAGAGDPEEIPVAGGLGFTAGTNLTINGAITAATSIAIAGAITSSSASAGIGYATGAGGTVTQATSKSTGVTLNKLCGEITMNGAALAGDTTVSFVLTNSSIAAGDNLILNHVTTGAFGSYNLNAHGFGAGSCTIDVRNITTGSLSEAIVIRFTVVKGVMA